MHAIQMKRVYDDAGESDGYRILVDRLWPRGVKKEDLPYDEWPKNITPSNEIRKKFNHEEDKFSQFKTDYLHELTENEDADEFIETVASELEEQDVTLLYAAKDPEINHVVILKDWLEKQIETN
jgi:uncharacterized protein YeaO (DUF488 family)